MGENFYNLKFPGYFLHQHPFLSFGRFMVDRLHFPNHEGCSLGYSMDSYSEDEDIYKLNSQVCEQAKKDLRGLSTPITFMSPEHGYNIFKKKQ